MNLGGNSWGFLGQAVGQPGRTRATEMLKVSKVDWGTKSVWKTHSRYCFASRRASTWLSLHTMFLSCGSLAWLLKLSLLQELVRVKVAGGWPANLIHNVLISAAGVATPLGLQVCNALKSSSQNERGIAHDDDIDDDDDDDDGDDDIDDDDDDEDDDDDDGDDDDDEDDDEDDDDDDDGVDDDDDDDEDDG